MSQTDSDDNIEETYSDEAQYTVTLNKKEFALNEVARQRIQARAEHEYADNRRFSCWWKVASETDAKESEIHETGDPILVIETEGIKVPWERLDQLELEDQTNDAFQEFDAGSSSDVNEGGGMKTVKPDDIDTSNDEKREKERTHFGVTPQDFEEVPSPDGEDSDRVPAKPENFDDPKMVVFIPDNPDVDHSWGAGEALSPMSNWVEWNVQQKANQPRLDEDTDDSHDHWETLLKNDDCEELGKVETEQSDDILDKVDEGGGSDEDVPDRFTEGTAGGGHWNV